ncbi:MAG: tetratricopeptide repeat protein [Candidatus Cryptobacteroides sp.]
MKKVVLSLIAVTIALMGSLKVSAQGKFGPDSTECIKYLSYYTEYYKQKNYDSAIPNWRQAYKYCPPTARYSLLSDGTTLLRYLINKEKNAEYKSQLIDSLMTVYDQRVEFWPKYATSSLNNKALDMYNFMKSDPEKLFNGLTEIIAQTKSATKPNIFLFNMDTACELYKNGNLDPETVINTYESSIEYLGAATPKNDTESKLIAKTVEDIESLFIQSKVASCDNLIALFGPRVAAEPDNLDLAKNVVKMMSITEGCTDNDLFLNAVNKMYEVEPSHNSAYFLYRLYSSRGEMENAVKFIQQAIDYEESDDKTDADYYYQLAAYCFKNGAPSKAFDSALKAAELDPEIAGKAYMLAGTIWGSQSCQGDEITRRAPYWVAVDYMTKAKNADPSLAEDADNYIRQYKSYFPQTAEAFMYDITDGQSYTVSCAGMRAVTVVRTQK